MPPRRERDITLDVDELIELTEDHENRLTPLEEWKAAVDAARKLWAASGRAVGIGVAIPVITWAIIRALGGGH